MELAVPQMVLGLIQPHHLVYVRRVLQQPYQEQVHLRGHVTDLVAVQMHHVRLHLHKTVRAAHHIMVISTQRLHQIYVLLVQHQLLAEQAHGHGHVQELMAVQQQIVAQTYL